MSEKTVITPHPAQALIELKPRREFFIAVDSDGCVFDSMAVKQRQCMIPLAVEHFKLQALEPHFAEAAEFVNLRSPLRGANRFPALLRVLDLLERRVGIREAHSSAPRLKHLRGWLELEQNPAHPALEAAIEAAEGEAREELERALAWSEAVNAAIHQLAPMAPYAAVPRALEQCAKAADMIVCSATPTATLEREWQGAGLSRWPRVIAGQEMGNKVDQLACAAAGKYSADRILFIGDSPGDLHAARRAGGGFFPIVPGAEDASWEMLADEGLDRFLAGQYKGDCEDAAVQTFLSKLIVEAPWEIQGAA